MSDTWSPELRLSERLGGCRLSLVGVVDGHGTTMQEASNDMLARLFDLAIRMRGGGFRFSTEMRPPDPQVMGFLWEIGEIASRGGDIRPRVFGVPSQRTGSD